MKQTHIGAMSVSLTLLALLSLGCESKPATDTTPPETATVEPAKTEVTTAEPMVVGPPAPTEPVGASFDTKPFKASGKPVKQPSGLQYEDMTVGKGAEAKAGTRAIVHYTGTLVDGTKFDSSRDRDETFSFVVQNDRVIQGWHDGVEGMKVGGRRKLTIPYQLGYGEGGNPPVIPPKATLIFDIELMGVE